MHNPIKFMDLYAEIVYLLSVVLLTVTSLGWLWRQFLGRLKIIR